MRSCFQARKKEGAGAMAKIGELIGSMAVLSAMAKRESALGLSLEDARIRL
jgi:hypothetical protein